MWTQHFYKILLLLPAFLSLSTCDPCTPEFLPNLKDVVQLKYNERTGEVTKMILKLTDNQPFLEMFTQTCREVSNLRVDYREVGSGNWRKHTGRRNRIQLNKKVLDIKKLDPCAEYEVKIVAIVEGGVETDSEILNFGPFYKELDEDTIKEKLVGEDSMPDISDSISYSNISSSGFTVSWGKICAQSLNFYLLSGPDFAYDHTPYQMMSNVLENDAENSLWISTEPCHQYRIAIESFMTKEPIPEEDNDGRSKDHTAMEDVITDPITDTLIVTSMEEDSYLLTWQFTPPTDCVSVISYEILLIPETGEDDHPLMQGDWMDQSTELELSGSTYTACSNYQLQMKISFTTTAGNSGEKIVFQNEFRTNQVGQFAPEGSNDLAILEDGIAVTFETCDKEVSMVLEDINENPIGEEFVVTPDSPSIELGALTDLTVPCASYNIKMKGMDAQEFPVKKPQGEVSFQRIGFTTSTLEFAVEDIEENSQCQVNMYQVICQQQEYNNDYSDEIGPEIGESVDGSFVEVQNLSPITSYKCKATIEYTGFEDNTDITPKEAIEYVTEGFDSMEIVDGSIIVTCESKVEELQLALVHPDGTRIKSIDANCTNNQSVEIFADSTQPCVEYSLELFEKKDLDVFDLSSSSDLDIFDDATFPVKPPESHLEIDFLRSDDDSLEFNIENSIENQHCKVESYSLTCNMVSSMELNGGNDMRTKESESSAIRVEGLIRGEAYTCSAQVMYIPSQNVTDQWLGNSEPMVVDTEGFDSFEFTEENSIQVRCESNTKHLKLVLEEVDGEMVASKDADCEGPDNIEEFRESMKPCGEYKIELISRQDYDDMIRNNTMENQGYSEDIHPNVIQEEFLDVKMPGGQPELELINTNIDNMEFQVLDDRNVLCEVDTTEIWCNGESIDHIENSYQTSVDPSYIKVADLSPETLYSCVASISYEFYNQTDISEADQYNIGYSNETTIILRSNRVSVQTLPRPTEPPFVPAPTEPPFVPAPTEPPFVPAPSEIPVNSYPTPHTRSGPPPSDNTPAITGAVVGVVIVLILVTVALVLKKKRSSNNNNVLDKESAIVKVDLAESTVTVEDNTEKENNITNLEKEDDDVIIKNGDKKDVHVDMEIENVLKEKESIENGLKESSL